MKTDRELLELAAKAAGEVLMYDTFGCSENPERVYNYWNPLQDDGDALRLVVKLGFAVRRISNKAMVSSSAGQFDEYCDRDSYAATRRAIVRAAAAIGEKL